MTDTPVIRIYDLTFSYGEREILSDVDFMVSAGEFSSMIGPNGGGKTTLLKLMLGLLEPTRGRVEVFGVRPEKARLKVGYVPQYVNFDPQFPVTVRDVVAMGCLSRGKSRHEKGATVTSALAEVGLEELAGRGFETLSGGQRQRVLVARALAANPELLLLDEPTSNVDMQFEAKLFDILSGLNRRMTILLVSHDLGVVSRIVKSVICVNRRVAIHPTSALTGELVRDIYGGDIRMVRHDHRCSPEGHTHG